MSPETLLPADRIERSFEIYRAGVGCLQNRMILAV